MKLFVHLFLFMLLSFLSGCYGLKSSKGGGQTKVPAERDIDTEDVALPPGYQIEVVAQGLTFPTGITFDEQGTLYTVEAGYAYGEEWMTPRLLRIEADGKMQAIALGSNNGPWNGIDYHDNAIYVAEGGEREGGKILKITPTGEISVLVDGLPSMGDHHTNGPIVGPDGAVYFGQGTATNSAVVGEDNAEFGWLSRHPEFHDIPCEDVVLSGMNFTSANPLSEAGNDKISTGAYSAFGVTTKKGQVITGQIPCSGAIFKISPGGTPELVAWGLRNPYGMAFAPDGSLYITENSFDDRGSRPVWGTGDYLWKIEEGKWYGWPDYAGGLTIDHFKAPGEKKPQFLLQEHPAQPPKPAATMGVHSSATGMDFSDTEFGYEGQAFIAQFGDMAPNVGKVLKPVGFKVVRVDVETGVIQDFAVNKGKNNGPASWLNTGGLERPIDVAFNPAGDALYVVDFGVLQMTDRGVHPVKGTGVIWKITKTR